MKFKCPSSQETHEVPEKMEHIYNNYTTLYKGKIHNLYSKRVVVSDGYGWYFPEETLDYPGDKYDYISSCEVDKVEDVVFDWRYWHGFLGGWFETTDKDREFWIKYTKSLEEERINGIFAVKKRMGGKF